LIKSNIDTDSTLEGEDQQSKKFRFIKSVKENVAKQNNYCG